jgi:phage repressor protein C with HTH and peptisase S24 domain
MLSPNRGWTDKPFVLQDFSMDDGDNLGAKLKRFRDRLGISQAELGSRLQPPVGQQQIQKLENGERELTVTWMRKLAPELGVRVREFIDDEEIATVPVVGGILAGDETIEFLDDGGELGRIEAPPGAHDGVAVQVRGNSMVPRFFDGDYVFYSRRKGLDPAAFLNRDCVVRLADGRTMLKRVEIGARKGQYTLRSYNPATPSIPDARLEWVGPVIWVKPR